MKTLFAILLLFAFSASAETLVQSGHSKVESNLTVKGIITGNLSGGTNLDYQTGLSATGRTAVSNAAVSTVFGRLKPYTRITFETNGTDLRISADSQFNPTNIVSYETFTVADPATNTTFRVVSILQFTNNDAGTVGARGVYSLSNNASGLSAIYTNTSGYQLSYVGGDWNIYLGASKLYMRLGVTDPRGDYSNENGDFPGPAMGGRTNAVGRPLLLVTGARLAMDGGSVTNVSWNNLVDVPAGFADGTDDGGGGSSNYATNYDGRITNSFTVVGSSNTTFTPSTVSTTAYGITNSVTGDGEGQAGAYWLLSGTHGTTSAIYTNATYKVSYSSGGSEWQFFAMSNTSTILYYRENPVLFGLGEMDNREGLALYIPNFTGLTNSGSQPALVISGARLAGDGGGLTNVTGSGALTNNEMRAVHFITGLGLASSTVAGEGAFASGVGLALGVNSQAHGKGVAQANGSFIWNSTDTWQTNNLPSFMLFSAYGFKFYGSPIYGDASGLTNTTSLSSNLWFAITNIAPNVYSSASGNGIDVATNSYLYTFNLAAAVTNAWRNDSTNAAISIAALATNAVAYRTNPSLYGTLTFPDYAGGGLTFGTLNNAGQFQTVSVADGQSIKVSGSSFVAFTPSDAIPNTITNNPATDYGWTNLNTIKAGALVVTGTVAAVTMNLTDANVTNFYTLLTNKIITTDGNGKLTGSWNAPTNSAASNNIVRWTSATTTEFAVPATGGGNAQTNIPLAAVTNAQNLHFVSTNNGVALTNVTASWVSGTLSNSITGNAQTASTATYVPLAAITNAQNLLFTATNNAYALTNYNHSNIVWAVQTTSFTNAVAGRIGINIGGTQYYITVSTNVP